MASKTNFVTIRMTPEARKRVALEAEKEGRTMSNFLQMLILKAMNDRAQSQQAA
jgi:predicted DNA-binding protein